MLKQKYFAFDSRVIRPIENARLALGQVEKDPRNPLFVADRKWEPFLDNLYGNVIFDEADGWYKCWYGPFIYWEAVGVPGHAGPWTESGVCFARSRDGILWEKPELGLIEFEGSTLNNLVMRMAHGAGVFKDDHDPDPSRRYKMFYKNQHSRTPEERIESRLWANVATSPDGLRWTVDREAQMPFWSGKQCDTHNNLFWDERQQKYVLFTRTWLGSQQDPGFRIVARMESPDFRHWSRPVDILRELPEEVGHRQVYAMPVFPCGDLYLGLATLFNTDEGDWTVDCELAWSPNTWHWYRVCPGEPLVPRGPAGSQDAGTIYGCRAPIVRDGEIRIYYGGFDRPHHGFRAGSLCLARLRPDGWAGYRPEDPTREARVHTVPLEWSGADLCVTADAAGGSCVVEILDSQGRSVAESAPVTGNVTDAPVKWMAAPRCPASSPVRLCFVLRKACLYAFGFR